MSGDNEVAASLAAVTALTRLNKNAGAGAGAGDDNESYTKTSLNKLRSSNDLDRNELQKLNSQLESYLGRTRALEALNQNLLKEVEEAKARQIPKNDDKKELAGLLNKARQDLENESKDCVKHEVNIERDEAAKQEYINRIKFFEREAAINKQKIAKLMQELADFEDEKEYIIRSADQAENDITREQNAINKAEKDLGKFRQELANLRNKNKQLEFEMQTLQDEKEFCRAVHEEEVAALKNSMKAIPSTKDLNKFYQDQLKQAVKDIKGDFQRLSKQQLDDLKDQKEAELAFHKDNAEKQKAAALRKASPLEREVADITLGNLPDISRQERDELMQLNAKNMELANHLARLEDELANLRARNADELMKRDNEINDLRNQNDNYLTELAYWDRVTRAKLQSEILTYKNLLDCQARSFQSADNDHNKKPIIETKQEAYVDKSSSISNKLPPSSQQQPAVQPAVQPPPPVQQPPPPPQQSQEPPQTRPSTVIISSAQSGNKLPSPQSQSQVTINPGNVIISGIQPPPPPSQEAPSRPSTVIISSAQSNTKPPSPIQARPAPQLQTAQQQQSSVRKEGDIYDYLRKVFDMFDRDKSGYINSLEFQNVLSALDIDLSREAYDQILREVDIDHSRDISFDEFCIIMEPAVSGSFNRDELYRAFKRFDKDNSGYITVKELHEILSQMGQKFSEQQIQNLISTVDNDNDGRLNFEEFYTLLTRPLKPTKVSIQQTKKKSVTIVTPLQQPPKSKHYDILRRVFDMFDKDKSGYINSNEFNDVLLALDLQISDSAYENILKEVDIDNSRNISFEEFCKIMEPALTGDFNKEDLYFAFKHFDKDNSGYITVKELSQILSQIGQSFSEDQIARMVARVDKDNDGKLSFDEFVVLMSTPIDK